MSLPERGLQTVIEEIAIHFMTHKNFIQTGKEKK